MTNLHEDFELIPVCNLDFTQEVESRLLTSETFKDVNWSFMCNQCQLRQTRHHYARQAAYMADQFRRKENAWMYMRGLFLEETDYSFCLFLLQKEGNKGLRDLDGISTVLYNISMILQ